MGVQVCVPFISGKKHTDKGHGQILLKKGNVHAAKINFIKVLEIASRIKDRWEIADANINQS